MYEKFKYDRVALSRIKLDDRNPRIVTPEKPKSEAEILSYLFEHEDLSSFLRTIAAEGRNPGAERPYVVKEGKDYVVVEGNTRIATYKLLTAQASPPQAYVASVPLISKDVQDELLSVDVTIAPNRDALMIIMARAHFGRGDKSRWGYLGSRKAVYDDWKAGKSIGALSNVFGRSQGSIRDLLLEYMLYLGALTLEWTPAEKEALFRPSLEFNPPVRFLQTTGHRQLVGIEMDKTNLEVKFTNVDGQHKLRHLIKRTVIEENGPSAVASYAEVFSNYASPDAASDSEEQAGGGSGNEGEPADGGNAQGKSNDGEQPNQGEGSGSSGGGVKNNALFSYPLSKHDLTLSH